MINLKINCNGRFQKQDKCITFAENQSLGSIFN